MNTNMNTIVVDLLLWQNLPIWTGKIEKISKEKEIVTQMSICVVNQRSILQIVIFVEEAGIF